MMLNVYWCVWQDLAHAVHAGRSADHNASSREDAWLASHYHHLHSLRHDRQRLQRHLHSILRHRKLLIK